MSPDFDSLERDAMAFPDDSDRKAMLDMLVRGRELDDQYNKTIKQWQERDRLGQRREWFLRILFFLPLSIALGCFPAQGIFEGRIKNFFVDVSWFSSQEYPYAYWNSVTGNSPAYLFTPEAYAKANAADCRRRVVSTIGA